jgi:hypothetical protein
MTVRVGRAIVALALAALAASAVVVLWSPLDLLLFATLLAAFTAPGWPLARWYAGDDSDWLTRTTLALLLGYIAGATVYAALRLMGISSPTVILLTCLLLALLLQWSLRGPREGVVALARLGAADLIGLGLLWLMVAAIVGPVFARVGVPTPQGLAYRAYFIADLFAHMTVVAELIKGAAPPLNPFYPHEAFPYYWTSFTLPAVFAAWRPALLVDRGLLLNDLMIATLMVSTGYMLLRAFGVSALAATISWAVVVLASSFEGAFFLWRQYARGRSFDAFRYVNIDGLTRWIWDLPPVDGLHRMMWYTPQHELAISFGMLVIAGCVLARKPHSLSRGVADGLLLGAMLAFSSFNGMLLVASYALAEVGLLAFDRGRDLLRWIVSRGVAAVIAVAFLGLTLALGMVQQTPNALILGWNEHLRHGPLTFVLLSFGPALLLAPLGFARLARAPRLLITLAAVTIVCLGLFLFVDLRGHENTYVTFRTGQLFFVVLAVLLALAIDAWRQWARPVAAALFALLLIGSALAVPTVAMDWLNTRDIANAEMDPGGFPWTLYVSPDDQAAARWIRENLPIDALIQADPWARARNEWAFVTIFAQRRMTIGSGIFELNPGRFQQNVMRMRIVFRTLDVDEAFGYCQRMAVQYLYVGAIERKVHGTGIDKFAAHPDKFQLVYRGGTVEIYKVILPEGLPPPVY